MLYSLIYEIMKRTLVSVIILVVAFLTVMLVGAWGETIDLETGAGVEYILISLLSIILSLCAASFFASDRRRCIMFIVFAVIPPLFAGVAACLVAGIFSGIIAATTDERIITWFKSIAEPDKGCTLDETDE